MNLNWCVIVCIVCGCVCICVNGVFDNDEIA